MMTQFEFVDERCSSVMLAAHNAVTFLNETLVEQYAGDLSYCDLYFQGFQGTCFYFSVAFLTNSKMLPAVTLNSCGALSC